MSHTPGPWKAVEMQHGWHIGPQPDGVCSIRYNTDGSKYAEKQCNANLIAAAPDLLEALDAMIIGAAACGIPHPKEREVLQMAVNMAIAAKQKAKGESR